MRVIPLASGSAGNATLVEAGDTRVLVDCGLEADEVEARLAAIGVAPRGVDVLLLTHRHADHMRGATEFAHRHRPKVYAPRSTIRSIGNAARPRCHIARLGRELWLGDLRAQSFVVRHDAPDTVGWRLTASGRAYGHVTDLGCWDAGVAEGLRGCEVLTLEFNHDRERLAQGPDSPALKRRITADTGHLANDDAAALLAEVAWSGLRRVFVAHVSRRNNTPELALAAARGALEAWPDVEVLLAKQDEPTRPSSVGVG